MVYSLLTEADKLLKNGGFDYAFCGGYAIELFLDKSIRRHGDIDVSAFWHDRDRVILYMQARGWQVFEMCGGGLAHRITDISDQRRVKNNLFCFLDDCKLISISPTPEPSMFRLDFNHSGQDKLDFIEFLFNDAREGNFIYARNQELVLPMNKSILKADGLSYLAPELVLLYESTDSKREGHQIDFHSAFPVMTAMQRYWLQTALKTAFPDGHEWIIIEK